MNPKKRRPIDFLYDDNIDLNRRLFVLNVITILIVIFISGIEVFITGSDIRNFLMLVVAWVFILIVGIISIGAHTEKLGAGIICSVMCFAYFPITFIYGGGIAGDGPIWFIFNMLLVNVLLKGVPQIVFNILEILTGAACYIVSFLRPENIVPKTTMLSHIYSFTALLLISIAINFILNLEHRLYVRQSEKAEEQRKAIEALNASQNRFFSSMSHEIRTPINTIIGLNEMILRENVSDEVAEDAVNIRIAGKLLLNLINDILDMSKFQSGDMRLLEEPYASGNMLSDLVGMLWIRAKEKNLDFKVNVSPELPSELIGDEVRIKQVLMNVLNNAIKYTKEGSVTLSVECEKLSDDSVNVIYTVTDTGMGIKKEDMPYLFTAFKRVDESNVKHIEGTGLGLSIVKQFVDLMNGKVTVNSVYTKGSTFIIEIPQRVTTDKTIGDYDYKESHKIGRLTEYKQKFEAPGARILVVDDNKSNLLVVTKLLRETKITIDTATGGEEALNYTLNNFYHLIFMDHLMPEMDGIECYKAIRSQTGGKCKKTPVVVLTANVGEENRKLYALQGFDGYLVKPVSGEDLENEVLRFLPKEYVKIIDENGISAKEATSWMQMTQKKKKVVITTESVADLPMELLTRFDIAILPHKVKTEFGTFKDGEEIDTTGVITHMENTGGFVEPIPPTVGELEAFFAEQLQNAVNVIHLTISRQIPNSSYKQACEAAESFDNVYVFDSGHVSGGTALMALAACTLAKSGMSAREILGLLGRFEPKVHTSFIVDNLDYLARMGQVKRSYANLFKSLMLRPVVVVKKGKMKIGKLYYGERRKSWKKYIHSCLTSNKIQTKFLFVIYSGLSKKEIEQIKEMVGKEKSFDEIYFREASPSIAANCGPGTFGLLWTDTVYKIGS